LPSDPARSGKLGKHCLDEGRVKEVVEYDICGKGWAARYASRDAAARLAESRRPMIAKNIKARRA
jgi:hypothetical protein